MSYYGTEPEIIENLEKELAAAIAQRDKAVSDADHFFVLCDKAVADANHFFVLSGQYLERANDAEAQRDKVRDDALEQAAMVCDEYAKSGVTGAMVCAAAIREMKVEK